MRSPPIKAQTALQQTLLQAYTLLQKGELEQTARLCRAVLGAAPEQFEALHLLGVVEAQRANPKAAADLLGRAVRVRPDDATAALNYANALLELKQPSEALERYDHVVARQPDNVQAFYNRGVALAQLGRLEEALASYERTLTLRPTHADAAYGVANMLRALQHGEAAIDAYDRALQLNPTRVEFWVNRANALQELRRLDDALVSYARAQALAPDDASIRMNEALCLLLKGDYEKAWPLYESRRDLKGIRRRGFDQPRWTGSEPIAGKTVLLYAEQGFGDTLHFCRYAPLVAAHGGRVVLEVQPSLVVLLESLAGVAAVCAHGDRLPAFDLQSPLLSLPFAFATRLDSVPAEVPYLQAPRERVARWNARLGPRARPRVGLTWASSGSLDRDQRNLPLSQFAGVCIEGVDYVALHKDISAADRGALATLPAIRDVSTEIVDFADTAALVELMDAVVSVDTATAHLAGAMAKPLLVVLPYSLLWRWLLDRSDSPWYPTARVFRQTTAGDWREPLARAKEKLATLLPGR